MQVRTDNELKLELISKIVQFRCPQQSKKYKRSKDKWALVQFRVCKKLGKYESGFSSRESFALLTAYITGPATHDHWSYPRYIIGTLSNLILIN